jgi:hypothetical protein
MSQAFRSKHTHLDEASHSKNEMNKAPQPKVAIVGLG